MTRPRRCPLLRDRWLVRGPSTGSEDAPGQPRSPTIRPRGLTVQLPQPRTSIRRACRFDHTTALARAALRSRRHELIARCLNFSGTGVRHEAPCNRVEVKDLRRWAVAAAW